MEEKVSEVEVPMVEVTVRSEEGVGDELDMAPLVLIMVEAAT